MAKHYQWPSSIDISPYKFLLHETYLKGLSVTLFPKQDIEFLDTRIKRRYDMKRNFARFHYIKEQKYTDFFELRADKELWKIFAIFKAFSYRHNEFVRGVHVCNIYETDDSEENDERQVLKDKLKLVKNTETALFNYFYDIDRYLFDFNLPSWIYHKDSYGELLLTIHTKPNFIEKHMRIQILYYPKFFIFDLSCFLFFVDMQFM